MTVQVYTFRSKFLQAHFFFFKLKLKPSGHSVSHLKNINNNDLCTYNLVHLGNFWGKYAFTVKLPSTKGRKMKTSIYLFGLALCLCVKLNSDIYFGSLDKFFNELPFYALLPPNPIPTVFGSLTFKPLLISKEINAKWQILDDLLELSFKMLNFQSKRQT